MSKYTVVTARHTERFRELSDGMVRSSGETFLDHDNMVEKYWPLLAKTFPDDQFCLVVEESDRAVAIGNSIPLAFRGEWAELPAEGLDWVLEKGFEDRAAGIPPTIMSALYIEIADSHRGQHVSSQVLAEMRQIARSQGFSYLVAPVRPSLKNRYPLMDIEAYLDWQTPEGLPFDPWHRVHVRAGGRVLHPCRRAMRVRGTRQQWADWTGMEFPGDGEYVIPHGLVPVSFHGTEGEYVEPGVWVLHGLK